MRIVDGKNVVLFGPEWSQKELMELVAAGGCSLKRHESGAIEVVRKSDDK
jgi:hypothetical protein